jgi:hypothetical protein
MTDQPKDTRLWCLHHIGADEVHPAPDFATAQRWADWANKRFAERADISRFVVALWPHTAAQHASSLAKTVYEWTLPEQSADAKREALIIGLLERIHWQIDCEVKREDVAGMIDSLDEYGMAFVSIPRWTCASDAQRAVDAYHKGDADPRLIEACRCVIEQRASTYRARNGREVGIQGDDGEKVWLVHSEPMFELESAYGAMEQKRRVPAEPPSINASKLQDIRDAFRAFENALILTPAASSDFRAGMKGGFNAADNVILGMMNAADRGGERIYEPYPGAFDGLLGPESSTT